ncbi:MAG: acetylornithine deacetylase/succinyl-diaminopimelate desuccinylase family protein [candidate division Zixibacteria bacterium]|nr:acetylornithine deacetylase/succinyl-diaminopimelate desuccinylase family protein [candidate division Zixibacteria bacterium]
MITVAEQTVMNRIDGMAEEMTEFAATLIRVPTVNPPGEAYEPCARKIGDRLRRLGMEVAYPTADTHPSHTTACPRVNVVGRLEGARSMPTLHFNGHTDVVPAGEGWTLDPFAGIVKDGRLYGRGACDMKGGIAAAVFALTAIRAADIRLGGSVELSGTVDEESGGFAGMAYLAEKGWIAPQRTTHVIIPEPLDVDRICLGHRGVYWGRIDTLGRVAHGSMPFYGKSAIDMMGKVMHRIETHLRPGLDQKTTTMPVVPAEARRATLNINGLAGGQVGPDVGTPCVADRCHLVFDRRFLREESFEQVRAEFEEVLKSLEIEDPVFQATLTDLMIVHPVETPKDAEVVSVTARTLHEVLGREPRFVASPGTYDHKHVYNIGRVRQCIAYGPGILDLAHQPDEYCEIEHMVQSCKVMALTAMRLLGTVS